MKNLLILMSFLFVTVCYAAPPPDVYKPAVDEISMLQIVASDDTTVLNEVIEVREVTFVNIAYADLIAGTFEPAIKLEFAEMPLININMDLIAMNKPPSNKKKIKADNKYSLDKQHTNYGYPFTAN